MTFHPLVIPSRSERYIALFFFRFGAVCLQWFTYYESGCIMRTYVAVPCRYNYILVLSCSVSCTLIYLQYFFKCSYDTNGGTQKYCNVQGLQSRGQGLGTPCNIWTWLVAVMNVPMLLVNSWKSYQGRKAFFKSKSFVTCLLHFQFIPPEMFCYPTRHLECLVLNTLAFGLPILTSYQRHQ